eukprot:TRINITY_DN26837_c0_g1_i1.p2 TRINITY_DN26837_c0_g1~~TRINITY_DN26837_c0_g1_i1.p2  ORF type:complete len:119 (+),score=47.26 TRINITY_DN26837_c0_g1_i1:107-463(+)
MGDEYGDEEDQEITLNSDKITEILEESMRQQLGGQTWQAKKVEGWTSNIIEVCLKRLSEMKKPFKYVVTCIIMQKTGAGLHSSFSAFWDNSADGICSYPLTDNETIHCVVTVYGLKLD